MKPSEIMWNLFSITGSVDIYLVYLDCIGEEESFGRSNTEDVLDLS